MHICNCSFLVQITVMPHWDSNTNPSVQSEHEIGSSGAGRLERRPKKVLGVCLQTHQPLKVLSNFTKNKLCADHVHKLCS
jgi:hypothetical protein